MRRGFALCLFLSFTSAIAYAQNWPSFRGPNASGIADGTKPPTTWNAGKPQNILWKTAIPGLSHSSPILWGNQVFVITAISSDDTTKERTELIANGGHYIRGYDPLTGKELWRFSDNDTEVKMQAPQISNGLIYVTGGYPPGRSMYAFRSGAAGDISLKPGQETNDFIAWRTSKGSPYTPTPIVYGDMFYTCADNGVLTAYDADTGERIYQERLPSSFSASPVAADGRLYLASEDGDVFVVRAGRKFELLATNPMGQALMATPAISEGMLIFRAENYVYAIGERTSKKTE